MYGTLDSDTREWTDGLLSLIFKNINRPPANPDAFHWIIFDSDVDAIWVENMNSVMDDNKVLTLINGDFIKLEDHSKILFEVWYLGWASPATISRCGMVYVDPKNLSYKVYWTTWLESLGDNITLRENLN